MSPAEAKMILTQENIRNASLVMAALDSLLAADFSRKAGAIRKIQPHSESDLLEYGKRMLNEFALSLGPGCGAGLKMNLSSFVNAMKLLKMKPQMVLAIQTLADFDKTSESSIS